MAEPAGRRFEFDGRSHRAIAGQTVLDALLPEGWPILQRSPHYHRPRAPFCGVGQCTGCLVRVNGRPNVRACRYEPAEGDEVRTENGWPSVRHDLLSGLDLAFRSGVDTLHGFRRPAWLRGLYHRVVRRLSGFGKPPSPTAARALTGAPVLLSTETLVIGAGRAGRAATAGLVAGGETPLIVERRRSAPPLPGAKLLLNSTITFLPPPTDPSAGPPFSAIGFTEPAGGLLIRARRVIVATGSYDANLLFGASDRPGVLTADALQSLIRPGRRASFRHGVLFGAGARAREVLERYGEAIGALVAPGDIPPEVVRQATDAGVALYPRTLLLAARGRRRVSGVRLAARGGGAPATLACDAVVLAHRRVPNGQLLFQSGASLTWRPGPGAYLPRVDDDGRTSVPELWAAGSVSGAVPDASVESGRRTATAVLGHPGSGTVARWPIDGHSELEGYYRELLARPREGRWIACPCEDVLYSDVEKATTAGYRGIEVVKRYSALGTGLCQGRYCLPDALLLLAIAEGRPPAEVGYITQRPPVVPTPIAALAALATSVPQAESP